MARSGGCGTAATEAASAALVAPPLELGDVMNFGRGGRLRRRVRIAEVKGDEAAAAVAADGLDAVEEQRVVEGDEGAARRLHDERRLRICLLYTSPSPRD